MKTFWTISLIVACSLVQLELALLQCDISGSRSDCGYLGITQQQCEAKGCCWSPTDNGPWCYYGKQTGNPPQCAADQPRIDCGRLGTTQPECESHGCCWDPTKSESYCFFQTPTYIVQSVNQTNLGFTMTLMNKVSHGLLGDAAGSPISPLVVEVTQETNDRLHVKLYDPNNQRWEVPTSLLPVPQPPAKPPTAPQYSFILPQQGEPFSFAVVRKSDNQPIFDTRTAGYFNFADQLLSIATTLPQNYNIYGLGEHKTPLRLKPQTYTIWTYDTATPPDVNLYGAHPFYLEVRSSGNAHGVFLRNSNGMDVVLDADTLRYNVIGGILDFYFFLGPEPEAVIQQYQEVIGRPHMPPYWGLGFHQCRWGYQDLKEVEDVVSNYTAYGIPLDTMWTDIDYMYNYKDFTVDPTHFPRDKFSQFVDKLHSQGRQYVVIIDPAINNADNYKPYQDGIGQDIFIKDAKGDVFIGKVWPGFTAYPDFLNPSTFQYWQNQITSFLQMVSVDGLWIDMNEPSNFCNGECKGLLEVTKVLVSNSTKSLSAKVRGQSNLLDPPYYINNQNNKQPLNTKTLDPDAVQYGGVTHYNAHNLYGFTEAIATRTALENIRQNVRSFIISRSTFAGSGVHTGHWTGDNRATPDDMYFSIPGMLSFQMFGIPLVGSDICGFIGDTTEELCARWMALGAFYPFSRNHNTKGAMSQEPYRWSSVATISKKALGIRYSLLPYYYTLFYKAHRSVDSSSSAPAATVTRPLFFEFPKDPNTYSIDKQFMVGSGILISPQLSLGAQGKSLAVYFPPGKWYDWYTGQVVSADGQETKTLDTPLDTILVHLRGGTVIPMQKPGNTTTESRKNDYSLLVVLDDAGEAGGDVFLDDGVSVNIKSYTFVQYSVSKNVLSSVVSGTGYASANLPPLGSIRILGVATRPSSLSLNGSPINDFDYDSTAQILKLGNVNIKMDEKFTLSWS